MVELDRQQQLEIIIERINLCSDVVQTIRKELEEPKTPDEKADLLIAVEQLQLDVFRLVTITKDLVWGEEPTEE
jgi:hypothetical protein